MKHFHRTLILGFGLSLSGILPSAADLPYLEKSPWEDCFIGIEERAFRFKYMANGTALLDPIDRRGETISTNNSIEIEFEILETEADGKVVSKQINPFSLTSKAEAVKSPSEPILISGTVTGDAAFEILITPGEKSVSLSGRITENGTLTNPLSFAISAKFTPYKYQSSSDPDELERFEKKIKREEMELITLAGKEESIAFTESLNPSEKFPGGLRSLSFETAAYGETEFSFAATGKSKITFEDKGKNYLWKSFTLHWIPDPAEEISSQALTISGK
ncbi:MAG: hypothetical protein NWQ16_10880 [Akkermansiaceae bacterium]|nr:hypothetical protein [Akkermansiaceae bacterium]